MTQIVRSKVDPFTLEIVKDSLVAIGDEMFIALAKTSMSPIIYEVLDYASGLTDAKGQLLTQGNGVTGFIGMLSDMVKQTLKKFGDGKLKEGDIIIINDSYGGGGSHLSDVGLVMPIFYEGEIVAFSANKAHWTEVGGKDPGSFSNDATDIFQEGLQFPSVKLFNEGEINQAIVDIIEANVRFPELSLGDMWAQVAALKTGEKRVKELCDKHGKPLFLSSVDYLLDHGEQLARQELTKLPKGTFHAEGFIDDDGFGNGPFKIKVKVTISDEKFVADFRGSHPQVPGPVNCSYTALVSAVRTIFLAITNPSQDANDGVFRPLEVITDKGSVLSAERPAPVSIYWESMLAGADLIWKALAPVIPHRLNAGHLLSVCSVVLSGLHQDTDEPFLIVEPSVGGWGASEGQDGARGQFCIGDGETYNVPVEVAETRYGIMVDEYSLHTDGAGAGEYIGGSGVIRSYKALTDNQMVSVTFGRNKFVPWGMNDGNDGSANKVYIEKANGDVDGPFGIYPRYPLNKGDVVKLVTATGGGYGEPFKRPAEKVAKDVKNGYITVAQAEADFGVKVNEKTYEVEGLTEERQRRGE
ncbi:hydantoinase B/oxoprolinase family protein [Cytobacillus oceanisediminis]|uniref:hydantoinase B/oxoprolinase family protein n=1 Tax=Cytobacillus oceanisediminis TaxID=665099 RepID=UPI001C22FCC0|nr:hydantoinase B/oxoprolinase family protein [Cytobacillus oceanisediminis]MBU8769481.1 hydantoinase B/oxoprolinase family protein [Cytobacillus oceanisediminis]MCM3392641.1 hydantoinase B/oxoprolinase family protein [Cytobacillus oceanisediminis]USK42290.1 hydantoinase B/oxoprolinase family protein [Cytobacillus oceanisediminis]